MAAPQRYSLPELVERLFEVSDQEYARDKSTRLLDAELLLASLKERTLTLNLNPGWQSTASMQYHSKYATKNALYFYSLRQQADRTYVLWAVNRGAYV